MFSTLSIVLLATALSALLSLAPSTQVAAAPAPAPQATQAAGTSSYWLENIDHSKGSVWGQNNASYEIFRNVNKFGAVGDGVADDTAAVQKAIEFQGRCGWGCNSSTILPAIVYFPAGTYLISKPVKMFYYTQMIGDATNKPVIKASANFAGMAVLDADPYEPSGQNWYINQNNFFRQVRNFQIDLTGSTDTATGIHWQVAQATSLQNIDFKMKKGSNQQGIFMDNGSGGWMSDLTFTGGRYGAFLGSQQFTSRNLVFTDCSTALFMNWNWGWTLSNITISGSETGIDMSNSPANQTVGSVLLTDSKMTSTQYGIKTAYGGNATSNTNIPATGGTLVLDNVDMTGVTGAAVYQNATGETVLAGGTIIDAWAQGNGATQSSKATTETKALATKPNKAQALLGPDGKIFGRSKPQYEDVPVTSFLSAKDFGCKGDGETDDTQCVQNFLNNARDNNKIAWFEHGAYLLKNTVTVSPGTRMVGQIWALIVADGASFNDETNPRPVFQIGKRGGEEGAVEMSDLIFETKGAAPGAIMVEWNMKSKQGESGMWDAHIRIGGSALTQLSQEQCPGNPAGVEPTDKCKGVFLMFHARPESGGIYLENDWFWVADHDLEQNNQTQISLYSARGALFQSKGAVWAWGSASEHSVIYNYQLDGVEAFFGGFMQTETPYFQPNPEVPQPFTFDARYDDPTFTICSNSTGAAVPCKDAWGLRVVNSKNVLIYAVGMYSFFNNYAQQCVWNHNCQENMIRIQNSQVDMYTVTTKAAVNMIQDDAVGSPILGADNRNVFGDTLAYYFTGQQSQ
ncbi:Glucan 1,3-beta-glucosidase [Fulvia fulva]|uniref:Glucan 1,3-beta-glucosidase n=1 Tax=Passalora fulva TaxID=5499 RepID=A0A9Q8L9X8_PASFU|nr:Glucan 1,3-beta-glucosidase [Fulvia fulva]UJO13497.1 Glucan 1,3-beta-glucosidase [Fulvia fulva]